MKNSAIDILHESLVSRQTLPVDIEFVYTNTHSESDLLRFVLNLYTWGCQLETIKENDGIKPTVEFMVQINSRIGNGQQAAYN